MRSKSVVIARRYGGAITQKQLGMYLTIGFAFGMALGYIFMGEMIDIIVLHFL